MSTIGTPKPLTVVSQSAAKNTAKPSSTKLPAGGLGAAAMKLVATKEQASTFTRVPMKQASLLGGLGGAATQALMSKPGAEEHVPPSTTTLRLGLSQEVKHEQIRAWVRGPEGAAKPGSRMTGTLGGLDDGDRE